MKSKVLITGASGFLGKQCTELLNEKEYEIHAVSSRLIDPDGDLNVNWHNVDLLDLNKIASLVNDVKADTLLHLAWYVAPGSWFNAHENYLWLQSSLELLNQFEAAGGKRVLMVGSGTEYDWSYGYCDPDKTPLMPSTYYGQCKHILSQSLYRFAENKSIQASWARIFFVYGPGENKNRLVPAVVNALLDGNVAKCTHGNQIRDFLHVYDAANAVITTLESNHTGSINIASGEPVSLKQLVSRIPEQLGLDGCIDFGAISPPPTDLPFVVANIDPLTNLGWKRKFDHNSGIRNTIQWWKNSRKGNKVDA